MAGLNPRFLTSLPIISTELLGTMKGLHVNNNATTMTVDEDKQLHNQELETLGETLGNISSTSNDSYHRHNVSSSDLVDASEEIALVRHMNAAVACVLLLW